MTLAALGAVILWFGWYGFNPGSTLSAMDFEGIGRVATNTTLAACAGALVAVAWVYPRSKKWDVGISINGLLAGLVAITCPCYWVSPTGSIAIGAIAGVIMILAVDFTEWVRVDDPCGAFAVHGACGIWGTLSLGLFAVGNYCGREGALLYGGNANQLIAQVKGSATIIAGTAAAGLLLMFGLKALGGVGGERSGAGEVRAPAARRGDVGRLFDRVGLAQEAGDLAAVGERHPADAERRGDGGDERTQPGVVERPHLHLDRGAGARAGAQQAGLRRRRVEGVEAVLGRGGGGRAQDRAEVGELVVERLAGEVGADDRQAIGCGHPVTRPTAQSHR